MLRPGSSRVKRPYGCKDDVLMAPGSVARDKLIPLLGLSLTLLPSPLAGEGFGGEGARVSSLSAALLCITAHSLPNRAARAGQAPRLNTVAEMSVVLADVRV